MKRFDETSLESRLENLEPHKKSFYLNYLAIVNA